MDTPKLRPTFYNICVMYELDYPTLVDIAEMAEVDRSVMDAMFVSVAVKCVYAKKILDAFSRYVGKEWTIDDVKVALLPTFKDICTTHQIDLAMLVTEDVSMAIIDMMHNDVPVPEKYASFVLQTVSKQTRQTYTLDNVDVNI